MNFMKALELVEGLVGEHMEVLSSFRNFPKILY